MRNNDVQKIVLSALFVTIVFVATFINIPFPGATGGLVHLGTVVLLTIAMRYGKEYGAIAGGIGMGLFDVMGGWMAWAPGTFIVRLLMGYIVGLIAEDKTKGQGQNVIKNVIAWLVGLIVVVVGYYLYEALFLTTFKIAIASIPGNIIQFAIGFVAVFISIALNRAKITQLQN